MKGKRILLLSVLFAVVMTALLAVPTFAKPKLNKTEHTVIAGQSFQLKVTGTKKKPKWSSSNKKVATVSQKGVVKARKAGDAVIKAKVAGKTLQCKVKVFDAALDLGNTDTTPVVLTGQENGGQAVFTFNQEGWYVARLEIQLYNKQTQEYSWIHSDGCAIHNKTTLSVDTNTYDVARIGFQVWYFGWDNFYYNFPYRYANNARNFTLSGYGDYPKFTWS